MRQPLQHKATRGPGELLPGHGLRHRPHMAADLRLDGYTTHPEDFSSCTLRKEDLFE